MWDEENIHWRCHHQWSVSHYQQLGRLQRRQAEIHHRHQNCSLQTFSSQWVNAFPLSPAASAACDNTNSSTQTTGMDSNTTTRTLPPAVCTPRYSHFQTCLPFWLCLDNFVMISLTFQELSCWQTDRQTKIQTATTENNTTLVAWMVMDNWRLTAVQEHSLHGTHMYVLHLYPSALQSSASPTVTTFAMLLYTDPCHQSTQYGILDNYSSGNIAFKE